jgi:hypothetical protein
MSANRETLAEVTARLQAEELACPTGQKQAFLRYAVSELRAARQREKERASRRPGAAHMGWPSDPLHGGQPYKRREE